MGTMEIIVVEVEREVLMVERSRSRYKEQVEKLVTPFMEGLLR